MTNQRTRTHIKFLSLFVFIIWTIFLSLNYYWIIAHHYHELYDIAKAQAEAYFNKDLSLRFWATKHGGVYVPIDAHTSPNPYLEHVEYRDIERPDGQKLTLMNPAYMIRQIFEDYNDFLGVESTITSLKPLRPENAPDSWEKNALEQFENGKEEILEIASIDSKQFLRFMRPVITNSGCLKCHGHQGYQPGDIRGGISVSVPMDKLLALHNNNKLNMAKLFSSIYLFGCISLFFATRLYLRKMAQYDTAVQKVVESEEKFRTITDFTYAWEYWIDIDGSFIYTSPSCRRVCGYEAEEFSQNKHLLDEIILPDDQPLFEKHVSVELDSHNICDEYFRIIHKDGHLVWINHVCQPVYGIDGTYIGRRASNYEVTRRVEAEQERENLIKELKTALNKVKQLSGFLPICASCKKIRDDKGYWNQIESYIREHSEAEFSHGICPDCMEKLYPEQAAKLKNMGRKSST